MVRYNGKFDKELLNEQISKLEVVESGGVLITKYDGKFLKEKEISNRYESFDFKGYIKRAVDEIIENFNVTDYELMFKGGVQEIKLRSDETELDGEKFVLTFFILNSTDKTRALNVSLGLKNKNYTFITEAGSIYKKHYTGINDYVDERLNLKTEVFKEQLEIIKSLKGEEISLKDIKKIITTSTVNDKYLTSQESKYSNFLLNFFYHLDHKNPLRKTFNDIINNRDKRDDYYLDSYEVFLVYLKLFSNKDSYIIKNESERILRMSKYFKRRNIMSILTNEG